MRHNEGYHRPRGGWQPTRRQREVLDALVEGQSNAEIAARLGITVDGAKWHVGELLAQTGCEDRQALAEWWRERRQKRSWVALLWQRALWRQLAMAAAAAALALALLVVWQIHDGGSQEVGLLPGDTAIGVDAAPTPTAVPDDVLWQTLASQPLVVPPMSADGSCPVSAIRPLGEGQVLGQGPVSPAWGPVMQHQPTASTEGGWYYWKTLWIATRDYEGAVLIRGAQLDGPNEIRFERGSDPADRLQLPGGETWAWGPGYGSPDEVREFPSFTRVKGPGCYAWQVDGLSFSYHVVFELTAPPRTAPDWSQARPVERKGDLLDVELESTRTLVTVDLSQIAVFDCRKDCFVDVGAGVDPLAPQDNLCFGYLREEGGTQAGKLWVNRYTCVAGGRVIPP
jgi:DNA-binding CsgD family transcriptional regulator